MDQVTTTKVRFRYEQWKKIILECQESGIPVKTWCTQHDIKEQTYYYYLKKIRQEAMKNLPISPVEPEPPTVFQKLEVQVPVPNTQAAIIIRLSNATLEIAEGTSQQTVQAVLLALQSIC